ncbi:MAG: FHA domain-containing protein [Phycisphaerae bacterium]|nr:FHA domain-containing protein [Phycisphaerae bacterium]
MDIVLVYFKNDGERRDFPLSLGPTVVGRADTCGYRIPVQQVSREHCVFEVTEDGIALRDLNSSNGTYVNNKRIAETDLKAGDQIAVGPVLFIVQIDGEPADPKPIPPPKPRKPSVEDVAAGALTDSDDETSKSKQVEDAEFGLDDDELFPEDEDDSVSDALESLASGTDEEDDPFADLDDEFK